MAGRIGKMTDYVTDFKIGMVIQIHGSFNPFAGIRVDIPAFDKNQQVSFVGSIFILVYQGKCTVFCRDRQAAANGVWLKLKIQIDMKGIF